MIEEEVVVEVAVEAKSIGLQKIINISKGH